MKPCTLWILLALPPAESAHVALPETAAAPRTQDEEARPVETVLGNLGLDVSSGDGRYRMHLWFRGQFRFSSPFDSPPREAEDFDAPAVSSVNVRRARIKLGGNAYRDWLVYYLEYDVVTPTLLDLHLTLAKLPWLQLRIGQWKATYNRERVDSSGRQQFVERSIVNREFTIDRQPGALLQGRLFPGRRADSRYFIGVFNGNGINASNDDASMMWMGRYQWQVFGRDLPFSQSDVEHNKKPAATLALGAVRNRSPFTRFSTNGAGQLDGFGPAEPGRYRLTQFLEEAALKYRGFSFQHEFHWKKVDDTVRDAVTNLRGMYVQAGYLPWGGGDRRLKPLEIAVRYAWVDPDVSLDGNDRRELTFGANWFFAGHDNKVTFDVSRLELDQAPDETLADSRVRLQWEISF